MNTYHRWLPLVLAMMAPAFAGPAAAAEPAPETETEANSPLTVALEFQYAGLTDQEQAQVTTLVRSQLDTHASAHGLQVAEGETDLLVRVDISRPEKASSVYLITTIIELDGEIIREVHEAVCLRCTADEIATETLEVLPAAAAHAHKVRAEAAAPEPPPPSMETEQAPVETPTKQRGLGPVGYVGIASSALGLGAAIAGGVFLHRGRVVTSESSAPTIDTVDYRPAGLAMVGAGFGVMVVGNVLLALDLTVLRHRRTRAHVELVGINMSTDGRGIALSGRF